MQATFDSFRNFNYAQASVHLWVFKKSTAASKFTARYAHTTYDLNSILRSTVQRDVARLTEFSPYTYLAENNDNSCLTLPAAGSDFPLLKALIDRPEPEWRVRSIRDLKGAEGYAVKFTHSNRTVYAVKRSAENWKTSYPKKFINIVFENDELAASADNGFSIERNFDFYSLDDNLLVAQKRAFESSMQHRAAYAQAFVGLRQDIIFSAIFTNMQPLIDFVGTNATHLKRMATVEQRAVYAHPNFLPTLQAVSARRGYGLNFDPATNKIIPCPQTVKDILQVLLDHRLHSEITERIYDVPDATQR